MSVCARIKSASSDADDLVYAAGSSSSQSPHSHRNIEQAQLPQGCHVVDFLICLAKIAKPFSHEWRNYARDTHLGTYFVYFVKFVLEIFSKEVSHRRATAGVLTKSLDAPLLIK